MSPQQTSAAALPRKPVVAGPAGLSSLDADATSIQEPLPSLAIPASRGSRGRHIAQTLLNFCLGQGALQIVGALGGLLLVRKLTVDAYAQVGLVTGFQAVISILMDLGFASTIIPLVGEHTGDRALVGRYVRAARALRNRSFWTIAPVATAVFVAIMHRHHWSVRIQLALIASVLLSLYSGGKVAYFSAPLFIYGRLRDFYVPQVVAGLGRLLAYLALAFTGGLNAWTAAGLSAINVAVVAQMLQRKSDRLVVWPTQDSPETQKQIMRYVLPAAPAMIFAALQSQISLFLVSLFGGTVDIAQVAALGRIGQLFAVLMSFNVIVIEPYVARLAPARLLRNFLGLLLLAAIACSPVVLLAFRHPGFYTAILGGKYANLAPEMGWLILGSCINYLAGLLWIMNRARKWLFWSGSILEIVSLLLVQFTFLAFIGVRTVHQAVLFAFASSFCYILSHGYVSLFGFFKGSPVAPSSTATTLPA